MCVCVCVRAWCVSLSLYLSNISIRSVKRVRCQHKHTETTKAHGQTFGRYCGACVLRFSMSSSRCRDRMDSRSSHSALSACGVLCVFGVCSVWARLCITVCGGSGEESTLEQGNKSESQANRKQAEKFSGAFRLQNLCQRA